MIENLGFIAAAYLVTAGALAAYLVSLSVRSHD